jgi:catechol 2,3-dioxygenase-like lactoylglutathione lyase family enzyme
MTTITADRPGGTTMNPQITAVTLGVADLARSKHFYTDLGAPIAADHGIFISFSMGEGSSTLALYQRVTLAADAGVDPAGSGFQGITFNWIVPSATEVDSLLERARAAGATIVKPGQDAQWGGHFGYFADPDGYLWKVAGS